MEYYKNTLCVTAVELTAPNENGVVVLTKSNLNGLVIRGKISVLRVGRGEGNYSLYD